MSLTALNSNHDQEVEVYTFNTDTQICTYESHSDNITLQFQMASYS